MKQLIHRLSFTSLSTLSTPVAEPNSRRALETGNHRKRLPRWPGLLLVGGLLLLLAPPSFAQLTDRSYIGTNNGSYNAAANWSGSNVPDTATERAVITNGVTVNFNSQPTVGGLWVGTGSTLIPQTFASSKVLNISGGTSTTFTNEGTFASGGIPLFRLKLTNGTYRNSGTIEASTGTTGGVYYATTLQIEGVASTDDYTLDNAGGTISVSSNATLKLIGRTSGTSSGTRINGGALVVASGGTYDGNSTLNLILNAVTITNNGAWSLISQSTQNNLMTLSNGTTLVNNGVFTRAVSDLARTEANNVNYLKVLSGASFYNAGSLIITNQRTSFTNIAPTFVEIDGSLINNGNIFITGYGQSTTGGVSYANGGTTLRFGGTGDQWLSGTGTAYLNVTAAQSSGVNDISGITSASALSRMCIDTQQTIIARGTGASVIREETGGWTNLINWGTIVVDTSGGGSLQMSALSNVVNYGSIIVTNSGLLRFEPKTAGVRALTNNGLLWIQSSGVVSNFFNFTQLAGTNRVDGLMVSTSAVFNVAGGRLQGTGQVRSPGVTITNGATLAPGDSVGTLTMSNLTLASGAKLEFELAATNASDKVVDLGALTLGGQQWSDFTFLPQTGFGGGTYTLVDGLNLAGSLGATTNGTISYNSLTYNGFLQLDNANKDLLLVIINPIPEPCVLALVATVLAGVLTLRRRPAREP